MVQIASCVPILVFIFENFAELLKMHRFFALQEIVSFVKLENFLFWTVDFYGFIKQLLFHSVIFFLHLNCCGLPLRMRSLRHLLRILRNKGDDLLDV